MSLYNKYRPQDFDEFFGNEETVEALKGLLEKKEKPHAFLFFGQTGCGKTTLARIVAKKLGAIKWDVMELDTSHFRGIDTIRDLREQANYKSLYGGDCRVYILDECHKLTNEAMNALLKALEEPPDYVYYILCTTDPDKLLPTVLSRCQQFPVKPLDRKSAYKLMRHICEKEEIEIDKKLYGLIYEKTEGRPREILQLLEKVFSTPEGNREKVLEHYQSVQGRVIDLCRALINRNKWSYVAGILESLKEEDTEQIRRLVLAYCSSILLKEKNYMAGYIMEEFSEGYLHFLGFQGLVLACFRIIEGGRE